MGSLRLSVGPATSRTRIGELRNDQKFARCARLHAGSAEIEKIMDARTMQRSRDDGGLLANRAQHVPLVGSSRAKARSQLGGLQAEHGA